MARIPALVTCTNRKRAAASDTLSLRTVPGATVDERFRQWRQRVQKAKGMPVKARNLYSGDSWTVAQEIESLAKTRGLDLKMWVASTGYGLLALDSSVQPYAAT